MNLKGQNRQKNQFFFIKNEPAGLQTFRKARMMSFEIFYLKTQETYNVSYYFSSHVRNACHVAYGEYSVAEY